MDRTTTIKQNERYQTLTQEYHTGLDTKGVEFQTRRVQRDGVEEIQIEVSTYKHHGHSNRRVGSHFSLLLDPAQAEMLVAAIQGREGV